jgi:hypothetical protein
LAALPSSATNALNAIKQAAIAVDGFGSVLDVNGAASACLGNGLQLRRGRLFAKDAAANAKLQKLFDKLRVTPDTASFIFDPIVIRQSDAMPLVLQLLPVHPAARTPFFGGKSASLVGGRRDEAESRDKYFDGSIRLEPRRNPRGNRGN